MADLEDFGKTIAGICDDLEDAPFDREGEGWTGHLEGFCPVQGWGSLDGLHWYFRARWDDWSFEVYPTTCEDELPPSETCIWFTQGGYGNASWMKYSDAWSLIEGAFAAFRSRGTNPGAPDET